MENDLFEAERFTFNNISYVGYDVYLSKKTANVQGYWFGEIASSKTQLVIRKIRNYAERPRAQT